MWDNMVELFATYGVWGLMVMSFAESSFFPVPPDLVLVPLCLARPDRALLYGLACTGASVVGGYFGYVLGQVLGQPLLQRLASRETLGRVEAIFARYGGWGILIAALTPIPYKVFTIAAGCFSLSLFPFIMASIAGRGIRFFLEAVLVMTIGQQAVSFMARNFEWLTIAIAVAILAGYLGYRFVGQYCRWCIGEKWHRRWAGLTARLAGLDRESRRVAGQWITALGIGSFLAFFLADVVEDIWERELPHTDMIISRWIEGWAGPGWSCWNYLFNEWVLGLIILVTCLVWWRNGKGERVNNLLAALTGSTAILLGFAGIVSKTSGVHGAYLQSSLFPAISETWWASLVIWALLVYPPAWLRSRWPGALAGFLVLSLLAVVRVGEGYLVSNVLVSYAAAGLWSVVIWIIRLYQGLNKGRSG